MSIKYFKSFICFTLAILLSISLFSYSPSDPSFDRVTNSEVQNILGIFGSSIADILIQLFGLGAIIIIIVSASWSFVYLRQLHISKLLSRIISALLSILSLCYFLSFFKTIEFLSHAPGGAIGFLIKINLSFIIQKYKIEPVLIQSAAFLIFFISIVFALAIQRSTWMFVLGNINKLIKAIFKVIAGFFSFINSMHNKESKVITRREKIKPEFSIIEEDEIKNNSNSFSAMVKSAIPKIANVPKETSKVSTVRGDCNDKFSLPSTNLLNDFTINKELLQQNLAATKKNREELLQVLSDFGVVGEITGAYSGPVVTLFELEPAAGTKSSRIIGLADDIARSMRAISARIAVIPGRNAIGIELPNRQRETVYLKELLESDEYLDKKYDLPIILGKDIAGKVIVADLAKMPHLLVAGTTGSGKSVAINTMILSLVYSLTPEQCKFIMVDPKMLELSVYDNIPHLLTNVVTEPGKAVVALKWVVKEMENRYRLMANLSVRNIHNFNERIKTAIKDGEVLHRNIQTGFNPETGKPIIEQVQLEMKTLPFIVVIVDEMADLMIVAGKEIETSIQRLAQMARAAGIHIIMATQRPSVDVITGVIKANFPTRISFQVTSKIDSRTILGEQGAEQLLGKGDMLYMAGGSKITRIHGPFVADNEVEKIVSFLKSQGSPDYLTDITVDDSSYTSSEDVAGGGGAQDDLFNQAIELVRQEGKVSTSFIQRYLKIGYNRAASIVERMEKEGLISKANHVGKREVLM